MICNSYFNNNEVLREDISDVIFDDILSLFDGTAETYKKVQRQWFRLWMSSGISLTDLCNEWYRITRPNWLGWTTFPQPDIASTDPTTSSNGVKGGDNAEMVCIPSTAFVANRDDYSGNPLFAVTIVNWELDPASGKKIITAIKGISEDFEQDNPLKYVGCMQMTGYVLQKDNDQDYVFYYTDNPSAMTNLEPLAEAVEPDGTINNFVLHSKYMNSTVNNKMTTCSGLVPSVNNSHNNNITLSNANGSFYSGSCICDISFLKIMTYIKYASLTQDNRIQGCLTYNIQKYAQIAENDTNRIILTPADAEDYKIGSTVLIGTYDSTNKLDRSKSTVYNISGQTGFIIVNKENITINENSYVALILNVESTNLFTTVANGNAIAGTTIVSTWHWVTGTNDDVLGNDGSYDLPASGIYPAMIQGIEYSVGGWEVLTDTILKYDSGMCTPVISNKKAYQATSINSNMVYSNIQVSCPSTSSYCYIRKQEYKNGVMFPVDVSGGSSATFSKDAIYLLNSSSTSSNEVLAFGGLYNGVGYYGLSCVSGNSALSYTTWTYLGRLSPNGNRGEFEA